MKTVMQYGLEVFGWQGGTIHQVIEECQKPQYRSNLVKTIWRWGYRDGVDFEHYSNIGAYPVPCNSWNESLRDCFASFVLGLLAGIEDDEQRNSAGNAARKLEEMELRYNNDF